MKFIYTLIVTKNEGVIEGVIGVQMRVYFWGDIAYLIGGRVTRF